MLIIHTDDKEYIHGGSLKAILKKLDPDQFQRVHRSTIINIQSVKELKSRLNGDYDILMQDETVLRLSRNYVRALRGKLL